MERRRVLSRMALGVPGAMLLFLVSQAGIALADAVVPATQPPKVDTSSTSATTVQTSPTPSVTATSQAPTTSTVPSSSESAGGVSPGVVALICVLVVLAAALGIFFIRRSRTRRRSAGPGAGR